MALDTEDNYNARGVSTDRKPKLIPATHEEYLTSRSHETQAVDSFESTDLPWDVGPHFAYWPLQCFDTLTRGVTTQSCQTGTSQAEESDVLALNPPQAVDPSFSPVPTLWNDLRDSPAVKQQEPNDGIEWPMLFLPDSLDLKCGRSPFDTSQLGDLHNSESPSPASLAEATPATASSDQKTTGLSNSSSTRDTVCVSPWSAESCKICGKCFSSRAALKLVIPSFQLLLNPVCEKLLIDDFSKHSRYHVKPYACPVCPMGFSQRRDLLRHQRARGHGQDRELLTCPIDTCRFSACRKDNLSRHYRSVHKPGLDGRNDITAHIRDIFDR